MHPILIHSDLRATLTMPAKDESVGEHASNSKTSKLTYYIVDATNR
jgi:hypothetical protein